MPDATQPTEQPRRNHGLFSDHYLNTLPRTGTSPTSENGNGGERVKIFYSPETDSLSIKLRHGGERIVGEVMGEFG